jgi:hypothetical protein
MTPTGATTVPTSDPTGALPNRAKSSVCDRMHWGGGQQLTGGDGQQPLTTLRL